MQKKYAVILVMTLAFPAVVSAGKLAVFSEPSGAEIILNRIRTGRFTPDTVNNLPDSKISVSLLHNEYQFEERSITPREDSLLSLSFTRQKEFEPLTIKGSRGFGVLQLPIPPSETPWLLNQLIEERNSVVLNVGLHHIEWDGGISFEPIDTMIEVPQGAIIAPEINFHRRYGRVNLSVYPSNAAIYIDSTLWGFGSIRKPLTAGSHQLKVSADGFIPLKRELLLFPNQNFRDSVTLVISPDRDNDGFNDTVDLCPDERGIYEGCVTVQKREELKRIGSHFWKTFRNAPFTIELAPLSFQMRTATDKEFREIISLFNDGPGLLNNYRGVQLFNKLWVSRGFFIGSADVGYSMGGLRYEKPWDIPLDQDSLEILHYSQYELQNPSLALFTAGAQVGIQLRGEPFTFSLMTGYYHETITFDGITQKDEMTKTTTLISEKYTNDFMSTTARVVISLKKTPFAPSLYSEMSFAPNRYGYTGWVDTKMGVIVPWWKVDK